MTRRANVGGAGARCSGELSSAVLAKLGLRLLAITALLPLPCAWGGDSRECVLSRELAALVRGRDEPRALGDGHARYDQVPFAATHNSYSGGLRGSLTSQLHRGVRFVELDVHLETDGFRVGHAAPSDDVALGDGNPESDRLSEWLGLLTSWSDAHPAHAPVTVLLDLKDPLREPGELARLNALLRKAFGERLFTPEELGDRAWPELAVLRGRFVAVLSGDEETRLDYVRQRGGSPAVALDGEGRVVVAFETGELVETWTGRIRGTDGVAWMHRQTVDAGESPAVALGDSGAVMVAYEDGDWFGPSLRVRLGRMRSTGAIEWSDPGALWRGRLPSVRFDDAGRSVLLVDRSESGLVRAHPGAVDPSGRIAWEVPRVGGASELDRSVAAVAGRRITVSSGGHGAFDGDTLLYATGGTRKRVRPEQLAFVEAQRNDRGLLAADGARFLASRATPDAFGWAADWSAAGRLVRLWGFEGSWPFESPVAFAATDHPRSPGYASYCARVDCTAP